MPDQPWTCPDCQTTWPDYYSAPKRLAKTGKLRAVCSDCHAGRTSSAKYPTAEAAHEAMEAQSKYWVMQARKTAERLCKQYGEITIDDVREYCPPPKGVDPRVMGTVFKDARFVNTLKVKKSQRTECHGRPNAVWRLAA